MTAKTKPPRSCAECRYDGSWHFREDGSSFRCPNWVTAVLVEHARELTTLQHEQATRAAQQIITDAAESLPEFSANQIRDQIDAAQIPGPIVGAAFAWAASEKATEHGPLIAATGRYVQSSDPATRHRIAIWTSRVHRRATA